MKGNKCNIYIAGAHSRGKTLKEYLTFLYPDRNILAFLVDEMYGNSLSIDGVPVKLIQKGLDTTSVVYIATRGENHKKLLTELQQVGFKIIIPVTVQLDIELRNKYLKRKFQRQGRSFLLIDDLNIEKETVKKIYKKYPRALIYVAESINDKKLQDDYALKPYEKQIQVGAALTDRYISNNILRDDIGENISNRNAQFCELTGMYWIWKHAQEEYIGLAQYRRHFILPDDWLQRVICHDIDVIMPVPLYVAPNIEGNYKERHISDDWEYMLKYVKDRMPNEYESMKKFFLSDLYCPCNMFIMKKEILDELCTWLFPILDSIWKHGGEKQDSYMNRYPGFISERLITYFIASKRGIYNIVYSNKNFLK